MMANLTNRRNILGALATIISIFSTVYLFSCATGSVTGAAPGGKGSAANSTEQGGQPNAQQTVLGKLQVNFVDPVTQDFSGSEVQASQYDEMNYVLEIAVDGNTAYKQTWGINAREVLNNAVSRFSMDEKKGFEPVDTRSFSAYGTAEGLTEWTNKSTGKTFSAAPSIDMGYLIKDGAPYFIVTQREAAPTGGETGEKSARFTFCITLDQARQLLTMFGGKIYEKPLLAFIGDGVTVGPSDYSINPKSLYPGVLQGVLKINILNYGEEWLSTKVLNLEELDTVIVYDPDVVVINLGIMDFLDKMPTQETSKNLQALIDFLKKDGRKLYLTRFYDNFILKNNMTNWKMSDKDQNNLIAEYDTMFRNLSKNNNIDLITGIWDGLEYNETIGDDYLYPTVEGHKIMAGNFFKALRPYMAANNYLK